MSSTLDIGTRHLLKPSELHPHDKLSAHPYDGGTLMQMVTTIPKVKVLEELLITPDFSIANGRHRWKGAIQAGFATKAILPCRVIAEDDVDEVILTTLSARKHYSRSAVAYLARPHIEAALVRSREVRAANLKAGDARKPINQLSGQNGSSFADIAEALNVSKDMLTLAAKTVQLFKEADARLEKWLQTNLEWAETWEAWRDTNENASWQRWRAKELENLGYGPADPKAAAIIPESFREIYEAKLFSVEPGESMGLGAINKAVGSALQTKGSTRPDLDTENPALHITLGNKLASWNRTFFGQWNNLAVDHRIDLASRVADASTEWPDEVKNAVLNKLKRK